MGTVFVVVIFLIGLFFFIRAIVGLIKPSATEMAQHKLTSREYRSSAGLMLVLSLIVMAFAYGVWSADTPPPAREETLQELSARYRASLPDSPEVADADSGTPVVTDPPQVQEAAVEWTVVGGMEEGKEPNNLGGGNYRVRLNNPVSEEVLHAIGEEVRFRHIDICSNRDPECEWYPEISNVGMWFYLPGMDTEIDLAWGRASFFPDEEEIQILGLTAAEERQLLAVPVPGNRQVLGRWIGHGAADLSAITTVYVQDGKTFVERMFLDGSTMTSETVESSSATERRFTIVDDSLFSVPGEYIVIQPNGDLRYYDNDDRAFETGRKIE